MSDLPAAPSARKTELLEAAYAYALEHGMGDLTLRPLAEAISSSPRVLLYLFGSKDDLVRAVLARARTDELAMLDALRQYHGHADLAGAASELWDWLSDPHHRGVLRLWVESYARSLIDPAGPWGTFARQTVTDWLELLAEYQPPRLRRTTAGRSQCTAALALLRGALLDLLATDDHRRVTTALRHQLDRF
jgi:AcrR family transcriptional regulator